MENLKKSFLVRGNNIVGFGGSGEKNKIDSISVNGINIAPDENKNVDITVPSIDGLTKDADLATVAKSGDYEDLDNKPEIPSVEGLAKITDIPTKVSQLENDSNYLSSIPEEYITETELNAKGYLTEHQDLSAYATKDEIPTVPNKVSELTNDSNYQTAEQVNSAVTTEIAKVVADAPEDFDTLKEMSDWIAGHEDDASAMNSAISDNKTAITALQTGKADKSEIPTTLPADGGNSDTVNNHTVETDVPADAVFTDTIYDDTEVKESIDELNSNLDTLEFGEVAGGKNILDINKVLEWINRYTNGTYSNDILTISPINNYLFNNPFQFSDVDIDVTLSVESFKFSGGSNARISLLNSNNISVESIYSGMTTISAKASKIRIDYSTLPTSITLSKLMLQLGLQATDYEPYIPSVKTLAEETSSNSEDVNTLKKETTVNLLNPTLKTTTEKGITCTNNGDGTYTLNGTKTTDTIWLQLGTVSLKANKSYKLIGQSSTDTSIDVRVYDNDGVYFGDGTYKGATPIITPIVDTTLSMQIRIAETTLDNFIVKPMITTNLDATYDDFVPYTGNTGGLNSDVAEIRNEVSQQSAKINSNTTSLLGTVHKVYSMEVGNSAVDPVVISDFKIDPGYRYLYIINGSGTTGYEVGILMFINGMKFVPLSSSSGTAMKDSVSAIGIDIYIENGQLKVSRSATSYATTCVIYKLG